MANTEDITIKIKELTAADLLKEEIKEQIQAEVDDLKIRLTSDAAKDFWRDLKPKAEGLPPTKVEIKEEYHTMLMDLALIAISELAEKDLKQVLAEHLTAAFDWADYRIINNFNAYIMAKVPMLLRNEFKKGIINVLHQNQEEITDREIENDSGKKVPATVANWLLDYDQIVGTGLVEPLKKTEFLYQSINAKVLTENERGKLIKLIDFYEHLKQDSEHPLGVEEKFMFKDEDRYVEIDHGKVVEIGITPELAAEEAKPNVITIRHPHIDSFLDEKDAAPEEKPASAKAPVDKLVEKPAFAKAPADKFVKPDPMKVVFEKPKPELKARPMPIPKPQLKPQPMPATPGIRPSFEEAAERIAEANKNPEEISMPTAVSPRPVIKKKPMSLPQMKRTSRPVVSDIKAPQRVMGPLDELEQISLAEFRNLADNPTASAAKVKEKIDLLEEESVDKKAAGIKVWKKSPANQLYVDIGNQSIAQGKSVREIISQREQTAEEVLTYAEFEALADLNRELRF